MDSNANDRYWDVYVDGQKLPDCRATEVDDRFTIVASAQEPWDRLKVVACDECGSCEKIYAYGSPDLGQFLEAQRVMFVGTTSEALAEVVVRLSPNPGSWTQPWSINAFLSAMKEAVDARDGRWQWRKADGFNRYGFDFSLTMQISNPKEALGAVADKATAVAAELIAGVTQQLQASAGQSITRPVPTPKPILNTTSSTPAKPLSVFVCHAKEDKTTASGLFRRLASDGYDPWLDEEKLLPGQKWRAEIRRAVRKADAVVVCLSKKSVDKTGFVQREIRIALDAAEERPENSIYIIPARIEHCDVPERLSRWQWVDMFAEGGYERLRLALSVVRRGLS